MAGKHFWKLEMKCRTCGILCYRDAQRRWTHEDEPAEPHDPVIKLFGGGRPPKPAPKPAADGPPAGEATGS